MRSAAMKITNFSSANFLKVLLLLLLVSASEGCRRGAKPTVGDATSETAAESSAPQRLQAGGSVVTLAPAPAITNNVAPPLRMDAQTGKPILQGDTSVVRKRTAAE